MTYTAKFLCLVLVLRVVVSSVCGQLPPDFDLDGRLPVDPEVRVGTLENGLRYYVKENARPAGRASLRLVVNAGSLQEEENQRGLAHFLEHMAFNGTRHFEKHELVNFLESLGMNFGQHLNASTSFNQTIYQLEVPWENEEVIDKSLLILEDWAHGIVFDPYEINRERGVIVEEWRSGQGAAQRVRDQQYPLIYYNSHYAKRLPIGSMVVVRNAPPERLYDFYQKWYRPNLMAVIAVGDFDGAEVERKIVERFSVLENPEDAPPRLTYEVPDHEQTLFSIVRDPEVTGIAASVFLKTDPQPDASARDYRRHLVERLYFTLVNQRLAERRLEASPPYLSADVGRTMLGREKEAYIMSVGMIEGRELDGLAALAAEVSRAARDGFGPGELERAKADSRRSIERIYEERETTPSRLFAEEYTRAFLVDEPIPGIALERDMTYAFLDEITVEEVNAVGAAFDREENRVVLFTAPSKDGVEVPSSEALLAALERGRATELESYVDSVSDAPLLESLPEPGSVVEEFYHEAVGVHEWKLSNGAKVLVKPTNFKNDQILMSAFSEGGHSLVTDDEFVPAATATMILGESGFGDFSIVELEKKLAGTAVSLSPSISPVGEGFSGSASPRDLDTFFKLLYLQVTAPNRANLPIAFESVKARIAAVVANREKSPQSVFQDEIEKVLYGGHPRHRPFDLAMLEEMDPWVSLEVYKDRFQNAGDFTFVFVGAIELDSFRELVEQYVASLPTRDEPPEKARFLGNKPAVGQLEVEVRRGLEEKALARVMFHGDAEWTPENRYALSFARGVLTIRMREVLREEHGGVYGVGVYANLIRIPYEGYSTGFGFTCDPENVQMLVELGLGEIRALQQRGPRPEDVQKVRELHLREHERGLKENGYWLNTLAGLARDGLPLEEALTFADKARNFDPAQAQEAAQRYFDFENALTAILLPEY